VNILALDTTLGACSAAVARTGTGADAPKVFSAYELRTREHAEAIVPMMTRVMDEAGLAYDGLDAIAVTTGPGSFTGVRVGVSTARGLSLALGLPLIGVTSLEVMAHMALEQLDSAPDTLGIVVDARRGEVYMALFDGEGAVISDPAALTPDQAAGLIPGKGHVVLAGGGAGLVSGAATSLGLEFDTVLPDLQPSAATLASMALTRNACEGPLHPLYLRPPDAKPQTGKAIPRRG
jgi:tRNA threonylcarbamoyl adenosine modification protein YeaZ